MDLITPGSLASASQVRAAVKKVEAMGFRARVVSGEISKKRTSSSPKGQKTVRALGKTQTQEMDRQRFLQLKQALSARDSSIIWCIRGGYGSQKLMPWLMKMKKPVQSKLFIGYSDVTVLHVFFNGKWKWPTLHFPVLIHLNQVSSLVMKKVRTLIKAWVTHQGLLGQDTQWMGQQFRHLNVLKEITNKKSHDRIISSYMTGGNLSILQTSIGTPWAGDFRGSVLFLEEVGEAPYRVDRMLWHMQNAGVFQGVKAIALGDFVPSQTKDRMAMRRVLEAFAARSSCPVVEGVPCGHGKNKHPVPFMTKCQLIFRSSQKAELNIQNPFWERNRS